MDTAKYYSLTIVKTITINDGTTEQKISMSRNFSLPFVPFVGLKIELADGSILPIGNKLYYSYKRKRFEYNLNISIPKAVAPHYNIDELKSTLEKQGLRQEWYEYVC